MVLDWLRTAICDTIKANVLKSGICHWHDFQGLAFHNRSTRIIDVTQIKNLHPQVQGVNWFM